MDVAVKRRLLREMLFARRFEDNCYEAYVDGRIGGFLHLYSGQEACAHGVLEAARPGYDYVIASYRDHIHAIKCGVDPKHIMAELFGKENGCSKGRGGSMHIFDAMHRFYGGYAIVGAPFPLAAGVANGIKLKGGQEISIAFFGDAAVNQGTFHESLNMASLWKLPVLFVCENNLYGIGTRIDRSSAVVEQASRVGGYNIESSQADGQDIEAVYKAASHAVSSVRGGNGPYFLELKTYRFRGHSMSDSKGYRTEKEEKEWAKRDPVTILRDRLVDAGELTLEDFRQLESAVDRELKEKVLKFADDSPFPDCEGVGRYLFSDDTAYKSRSHA